MNAIVRTSHTTFPLLKISKIVAVLLLIFVPLTAQATALYQSSSSKYASPTSIGASSYRVEPASYQMTNTSAYQVGTTYNPAQTLYTPFSNENPSNSGSNGPSRIGGRKNDVGTGGFDTDKDPNRGNEPPIGDAWSLLIFAALAAGVIYFKQRKAEAKG
jgi:hypothetical protein